MAKNCMLPISGSAYSCMVMRTSISPEACFFLTEKNRNWASASPGSTYTCFQSLMTLPPPPPKVPLEFTRFAGRSDRNLSLLDQTNAIKGKMDASKHMQLLAVLQTDCPTCQL